MSRTYKDKPNFKPKGYYNKHKPNFLGICQCEQCRAGRKRAGRSWYISWLWKRFRRSFKGNKEPIKGGYTD